MPIGVYFHKGFKHTSESKKKMSEKHKGKRHSEETKRKISEAHKGQIPKFIPDNKGRKHSKETKKKMSMAHKGEKSHFWQGGISFKPYSTDWTETLKRAIRERDNYICQLCNQYGNVVHHIDYDKSNCNPNNLITLCNGCNSKVNKNRNYWTRYFALYVKKIKETNP